MSQTLDQIYIANPSTTMLSTDLLYLVHSPFTSGTDSAITYANFAKAALSGAVLLNPTGAQTITTFGLTVPSLTTANLSFDVTANSILSTNTNGNIIFIPNGTGQMYIGNSSGPITPASTALTLQIAEASKTGQYIVSSYANSAGSTPSYFSYKSRSTTVGSFVTVANGDSIASFAAFGDDGTQFSTVGNIVFDVSGTVSTGIVPGRIRLRTANSLGVNTTGFTLDSTQTVTLANALPIASGGTAKTSVTTAPAATSWAGWDVNSNLSANSMINSFLSTVTSSGTVALLVGSAQQQVFTGSTTGQIITMPVASTLVQGQLYQIFNTSSVVITVQSSGGNTIQAMAANTKLTITCVLNSGTTAASWIWTYGGLDGTGSGITTVGDVTSGTNAFDGTAGTTLTSTTAGLTLTAASNAGTGAQVTLIGGPSSTGTGGLVQLTGGVAASNGAGGGITLTSGAGIGTGVGGNITLTGGASGSTSSGGGAQINMTAGAGANSHSGGNITITAGLGSAAGGILKVAGGQGGSVSAGGVATIQAGAGGATSGAGGQVNIISGAATTSGSGGAVAITGGAGVGTNQNSSTTTITNSTGTGTGQVGKIFLQADASGGTTGTTAHTAVNRLVINGSVTGMTSGAASTIATPTLASGSTAGGFIQYVVEATDGTNYQCTSGVMGYAITNKAGTFSGTATVIGLEVTNSTSGTLSNAFSVTAAGLIQITPTVTIITASTLRVTYTVFSGSQQALAVPS